MLVFLERGQVHRLILLAILLLIICTDWFVCFLQWRCTCVLRITICINPSKHRAKNETIAVKTLFTNCFSWLVEFVKHDVPRKNPIQQWNFFRYYVFPREDTGKWPIYTKFCRYIAKVMSYEMDAPYDPWDILFWYHFPQGKLFARLVMLC